MFFKCLIPQLTVSVWKEKWQATLCVQSIHPDQGFLQQNNSMMLLQALSLKTYRWFISTNNQCCHFYQEESHDLLNCKTSLNWYFTCTAHTLYFTLPVCISVYVYCIYYLSMPAHTTVYICIHIVWALLEGAWELSISLPTTASL